jgi:hypothetical protein
MADDKPKKSTSTGQKKNTSPSTGMGVELEMSLLIIIFILALAPVAASFIFGVEAVMQNAYVVRFVFVLKIISGIVSSVAIVGILYVAIQTAKFRPEIRTKVRLSHLQVVTDRERPLKKEWKALKEKLDVAGDNDAAMMVIEADALADKALKIFGARGETMGERIKFISGPDFKSTEDLWEAHKMRNQIAHGDSAGIVYSDAVYAINKFEKALVELEMI